MSVADLQEVLRECLETKGVLPRLRATLRAEVFGALDDTSDQPPLPSRENLVINDLIREYLAFNKYEHTLAVFLTESGQPSSATDRQSLADQTGLHAQTAEGLDPDHLPVAVPLLYSLLAPTETARGLALAQRNRHDFAGAPGPVSMHGAGVGADGPSVTALARGVGARGLGETVRACAAPTAGSKGPVQAGDDLPGCAALPRAHHDGDFPRALGGGPPVPVFFSQDTVMDGH